MVVLGLRFEESDLRRPYSESVQSRLGKLRALDIVVPCATLPCILKGLGEPLRYLSIEDGQTSVAMESVDRHTLWAQLFLPNLEVLIYADGDVPFTEDEVMTIALRFSNLRRLNLSGSHDVSDHVVLHLLDEGNLIALSITNIIYPVNDPSVSSGKLQQLEVSVSGDEAAYDVYHQSLLRLVRQHGAGLRRLGITDELLIWIAENCKQLESIYFIPDDDRNGQAPSLDATRYLLMNCPLLTCIMVEDGDRWYFDDLLLRYPSLVHVIECDQLLYKWWEMEDLIDPVLLNPVGQI